MFRMTQWLRLSVLQFRAVRCGKIGAYLDLDGCRGGVFWF